MMMTSYSSSSSAASANVLVEKATSEFLNGPDWTINIEICDSINSNNWQAKDVVKALKKRLQHKNPNVHFFALTLLETMVKNCGEYVHSQIVERNILQDMVKIVKKKTDMRVREKILVLLDSWQEAFGGARGKYPQFYWAYEELRRSGVEFPPRTSESALIFTPPVTHPPIVYPQAGYGMPINSSTRLDEAMASEVETLSFSSISSMRDVLDLLATMLQAVNPNDRMAIKDEVILELVHRCRSNQKKLMQMLATTGDEELLGLGLDLNDGIQNELAKHDAIASGSPLPTQVIDIEPPVSNVSNPSPKDAEVGGVCSGPSVVLSAPPAVVETKRPTEKEEEEEEEEDDFALLARRHTKTQTATSQCSSVGTNETADSLGMALALTDPPAPVKTSKEQDMIDLLSVTLSTTTVTSPQAASSQNVNNLYASQQYHVNQGQVAFNGYVAPWAQTPNQTHAQTPPQQYPQSQSHQPTYNPQDQPQSLFQQHPTFYSQAQPQSHFQQPTFHSQAQPQSHFQQPTFHSQAQPQSQFQQPTYNSESQPRSQFQQPTYNSQAQSQTQTQAQPRTQLQSQPPQPLLQQPQQQPHSQFQSQPHYEPQAQPQQSHLQQPQQRPLSYFQPQTEQTLVQQQPQQSQSQLQTQPVYQPQAQPPQPHLQAQPQYPELSSGYPPPPWAATTGYYSNKSTFSNPYGYSTSQINTTTQQRPVQAAGPLQQVNFPPTGGSNVSTNSNAQMSSMPGGNAATAGQKPFVPSYRLFEDLNVLGSGEGRFCAKNTSGTSSQSMVSGRK